MGKPLSRLHMLARRYRDDERGVISVFGAFLILLGLAISVMVIDVGHLYLTKRRLQSAVDAAALAAAGNPGSAMAIAQDRITQAGYATDRLVVTAGAYTPDPGKAVADRLNGGATPANAVRVTNTVTVPDFLAVIFNDDGKANIAATATAAQMPMVSFAAGSGLAQLSGGTLNSVLGKMLGTTLSLSAANWQGLAKTNIDALTVLNALASRVGVNAGTYGDLANASVTMGQFIAAAQAAVNIHPGGVDAATVDALNLLSLQVPPGVSVTLSSLVDTSLWTTRKIGTIVQQDQGVTNINLLDAVTAMARLYGSGHLADVGTGISLPVTNTSVSAYLSVGQPMASLSVARVKDKITTSQARLALTVTAANVNLGVATAKVTLPVYVQIASGTAEVKRVLCQGNEMVTITGTPTAAAAQIGTVSQAQLQDFGHTPSPAPAAVVQLTVLGIPISIGATASATVAQGAGSDLAFSKSDIAAGTYRTAYGSDGAHLISGLVSNLSLVTSGSGITSLVTSLVNGTVMPLLRPLLVSILSSLDTPVDNLLQTLGVKIGTLDVTVHGVSCGRATIVG